jgi:hypothetical protein
VNAWIAVTAGVTGSAVAAAANGHATAAKERGLSGFTMRARALPHCRGRRLRWASCHGFGVRSGRGKDEQDAAAREEQRLRREVAEVLDPHHERSTVVEGDRVVTDLGKVLDNLRERMERLDLDPETSWSHRVTRTTSSLSIITTGNP